MILRRKFLFLLLLLFLLALAFFAIDFRLARRAWREWRVWRAWRQWRWWRKVELKFASELGLDCGGVVRGDAQAVDEASKWTYDLLLPEDVNRLPLNLKCSTLNSLLGFQSESATSLASVAKIGPAKTRTANTSNAKTRTANTNPFNSSMILTPRRSPLAFAVLTHGHFEQTLRLLRALSGKNDVVCIHVDAGADDATWRALRRVGECLDGVFFVENRHHVIWGDISLVDAFLSCGEMLLALDVSWSHVVNLAATAFPLRTNDEIAAILDFFEGRNLVEGIDDKEFIESRTKMKKDPPPGGIGLVKGTQYGAYTRSFIDFALNDVRSRDFRLWLRETIIPDEFFWATLNYDAGLSAPGGSPLAHALHSTFFPVIFVKWIPKNDFSKMAPIINDSAANDASAPFDVACASGVARNEVCLFGVGDLKALTRMPHIQINKFDMTTAEPAALLCIEEWRRNRTEKAAAGGDSRGGVSGGGGIQWAYYRRIKNLLFGGPRKWIR